jgi:hypothetical protein
VVPVDTILYYKTALMLKKASCDAFVLTVSRHVGEIEKKKMRRIKYTGLRQNIKKREKVNLGLD